MDKVNFTIIGAGVIGLAIAAELSKTQSDIVLLERHASFGQETSSRNSEVIHSGLYYPTGSLKHRLCLEGNRLLYDFCHRHNIPHRRTGKLIVATDENQHQALDTLLTQAHRNHIPDVRQISLSELKKLEPDVFATAALYSGTTGIVDSHVLMNELRAQAESRGVIISYNSPLTAAAYQNGSYILSVGDYSFISPTVINAAGLSSALIARMTGIGEYTIYPCKGDYFSYSGAHSLRHLVYPVSEPNHVGLGVHATLDLSGRLRFGPDATYTDTLSYTVDEEKRGSFFTAIKKYVTSIEREKLQPGFAGIRPKVQGPQDPVKDFIIQEEGSKGFPGLINCIGIESPGLTACLAIARHVASLVQ